MNFFEDNPPSSREENLGGEQPTRQPAESAPAEPMAGDPLSYLPVTPAGSLSQANLPEDLRISWSWPHLLVFGVFVVSSLLTLQLAVVLYFSVDKHLSQNQLKQLFESDPRLIIGMNVVWFALILFFLYLTLAVLRDSPFWQSLGWKKLKPDANEGKGRPWMYFLSGCGLSIFVALASSRVKDVDNVPIREFLKNRTAAMLLMAMAVLIAPLVEETVFRGYLYPVLARITSAVLQFFGMEFSAATRTGVATSILLTGVLFGLMHAPQLGWTWGLVSLLTLVGVIFTFARAWTGTVVASFLLHLGYNSMIAFTSIIATKGFTQIPPHP
ncbi:MAG TPA: CPBP family intramembrane glutamic endopeptidase [Candidatus Acidoferrum sp.]|nr:CPBP family intramembrane glutamic endopeptidase [Candidatus Acidoferrum sp.]